MKRHHILVPVSVNQLDAGQKALGEARDLIADGGKITVLNAHEPIPGTAQHYLPKGAISERDADITQTLRDFIGEAADCDIELVSGRAGVVVVDYADKHKVDCIIIASHRPGLKDYFLGSTASRVVRYASCPVFVLR